MAADRVPRMPGAASQAEGARCKSLLPAPSSQAPADATLHVACAVVTARHLAPLLAVVLVTGCSTGTDETADPAPAPTSAAPTSAAPASSPSPSGTVVEVTYAGGEVTGVESRVSVRLGEPVVLRFTSDVAEQIHVHGYDRYTDLVPGVPAEIAFTADIPGSFEVELHEAGRPLYQLRVA